MQCTYFSKNRIVLIVLALPLLVVSFDIQLERKQQWRNLFPSSLALSPLAKKYYNNLEEGRQDLLVDKEICRVSQIHGFQGRKGIFPYEYAKGNFDQTHFANIWHQRRHQQNTYTPPFPHHSCVAIISHKYKFIYIGIPKTGFRSTINFFQNFTCNGFQKGCFQKIINTQTTLQQYLKYYNDYFIFTFTRNPYTRAASAYHWIKDYMQNDDKKNCMPTYDQYCLDPYKLKETCNKYYNLIQINENNTYIINNKNNQSRDCCCYIDGQLKQDFLDQHLMPQSPCVFDPDGNSMVDFIGRTEYYKQDFLTILGEINKRSENKIVVPEKVLHVGKFIKFDARKSRCKYLPQVYMNLYQQSPQCLNSIEKYYYLDFKLFKYDFIE